MAWRVADFTAGQYGKLALDAICFSFARSDDVERADALSIQASILREAL